VGNTDPRSGHSEWISFVMETKRLDASADVLGDSACWFLFRSEA
jgi:hypothetical protein